MLSVSLLLLQECAAQTEIFPAQVLAERTVADGMAVPGRDGHNSHQ